MRCRIAVCAYVVHHILLESTAHRDAENRLRPRWGYEAMQPMSKASGVWIGVCGVKRTICNNNLEEGTAL